MTRKDYEMLAAALKGVDPTGLIHHDELSRTIIQAYGIQWRIDCEQIADYIASTSAKFDRALFLRNCGVQS